MRQNPFLTMIGYRGEDFKTSDIDYMMKTSHVAILLTGQRLAILQRHGNYGVLMPILVKQVGLINTIGLCKNSVYKRSESNMVLIDSYPLTPHYRYAQHLYKLKNSYSLNRHIYTKQTRKVPCEFNACFL